MCVVGIFFGIMVGLYNAGIEKAQDPKTLLHAFLSLALCLYLSMILVSGFGGDPFFFLTEYVHHLISHL